MAKPAQQTFITRNKRLKEVRDFLRTLILALAVAMTIRGFLFEPYRIPSSSMVPTLLIGDYLFITKYAYGIRIPFTRDFLTRRDIPRGDVVVFQKEDARGNNTNFIKRVVAVGGDTVAYVDKQLYVNGTPVNIVEAGDYSYTSDGNALPAIRYTEYLPGATHSILLHPERPSLDVPPIVVPQGHVVVMGDNRDNSIDSRLWNAPNWYFLPQENILGRAEFIWWSWDENWMPQPHRLFTSLRTGDAQ